jgi:transcriptional regulator with XRE-family HTH domain
MNNITISQNVDFGKALRRAQKDRHVRVVDIARAIGVAPNQVARWQKMEDIKLSKAIKIAAVFKMTLEEFMGEYHE